MGNYACGIVKRATSTLGSWLVTPQVDGPGSYPTPSNATGLEYE